MKRTFRILVLIIFTAMIGGMLTTAAQANEIRIATQPSPFCTPIFIAKHKGWVEEELAKVGARPAIRQSGIYN